MKELPKLQITINKARPVKLGSKCSNAIHMSFLCVLITLILSKTLAHPSHLTLGFFNMSLNRQSPPELINSAITQYLKTFTIFPDLFIASLNYIPINPSDNAPAGYSETACSDTIAEKALQIEGYKLLATENTNSLKFAIYKKDQLSDFTFDVKQAPSLISEENRDQNNNPYLVLLVIFNDNVIVRFVAVNFALNNSTISEVVENLTSIHANFLSTYFAHFTFLLGNFNSRLFKPKETEPHLFLEMADLIYREVPEQEKNLERLQEAKKAQLIDSNNNEDEAYKVFFGEYDLLNYTLRENLGCSYFYERLLTSYKHPKIREPKIADYPDRILSSENNVFQAKTTLNVSEYSFLSLESAHLNFPGEWHDPVTLKAEINLARLEKGAEIKKSIEQASEVSLFVSLTYRDLLLGIKSDGMMIKIIFYLEDDREFEIGSVQTNSENYYWEIPVLVESDFKERFEKAFDEIKESILMRAEIYDLSDNGSTLIVTTRIHHTFYSPISIANMNQELNFVTKSLLIDEERGEVYGELKVVVN